MDVLANCCTGRVAMSDIRVPLMWKDNVHFTGKTGDQSYYAFALIRCGDQVRETSLCEITSADTDMYFADPLVFEDLLPDFKMEFEVYYTVLTSREAHPIPHAPRASISIRASSRRQVQFNAPKFCLAGHVQLCIDDVRGCMISKDLAMGGKGASGVAVLGDITEFPIHPLELWGVISCQLDAQPQCMLRQSISLCQVNIKPSICLDEDDSWCDYFADLYQCRIQCWKDKFQADKALADRIIQLCEDMEVLVPDTGGGGADTLKLASKEDTLYTLQFQNNAEAIKWRHALRNEFTNLTLWKLACKEKMHIEELKKSRHSTPSIASFYDQIDIGSEPLIPPEKVVLNGDAKIPVLLQNGDKHSENVQDVFITTPSPPTMVSMSPEKQLYFEKESEQIITSKDKDVFSDAQVSVPASEETISLNELKSEETISLKNGKSIFEENISLKNDEPSSEETILLKNDEPTSKETVSLKNDELTSKETVSLKNDELTSEETVSLKNDELASKETVSLKNDESTSEETVSLKTDELTSEETVSLKTDELTSEEIISLKGEEPVSSNSEQNSVLAVGIGIDEVFENKYEEVVHQRVLEIIDDICRNELTEVNDTLTSDTTFSEHGMVSSTISDIEHDPGDVRTTMIDDMPEVHIEKPQRSTTDGLREEVYDEKQGLEDIVIDDVNFILDGLMTEICKNEKMGNDNSDKTSEISETLNSECGKEIFENQIFSNNGVSEHDEKQIEGTPIIGLFKGTCDDRRNSDGTDEIKTIIVEHVNLNKCEIDCDNTQVSQRVNHSVTNKTTENKNIDSDSEDSTNGTVGCYCGEVTVLGPSDNDSLPVTNELNNISLTQDDKNTDVTIETKTNDGVITLIPDVNGGITGATSEPNKIVPNDRINESFEKESRICNTEDEVER